VAKSLRGIKDSASHGLGRTKASTFAAVPDVIAKGKQIDFQTNWKGRGYDTYLFASPVKMESGEKLYVGVVVKKDAQSNRYYLHEVISSTEKNSDELFKTGGHNKMSLPGNSPQSEAIASNNIILSPAEKNVKKDIPPIENMVANQMSRKIKQR